MGAALSLNKCPDDECGSTRTAGRWRDLRFDDVG